jgi:hypothetical protein
MSAPIDLLNTNSLADQSRHENSIIQTLESAISNDRTGIQKISAFANALRSNINALNTHNSVIHEVMEEVDTNQYAHMRTNSVDSVRPINHYLLNKESYQLDPTVVVYESPKREFRTETPAEVEWKATKDVAKQW